MDLSQIRRLVIVAMFSDDELFSKLALKGGNALILVYKIGSRSSVDVDFSLEADFVDLRDAEARILRSLSNRFAEVKYVVFDGKLAPRPVLKQKPADDRFGGYEFSFKIIEMEKYEACVSDVDRTRREALIVGPLNQRTFKIQISKYEHCAGKREVELDHYTIYVYTPEMLAIEKLRAICQQMPEYSKRGHPVARARDFYDIYSILESTHTVLNSPENLRLIADIFQAKDVDVKLMKRIADSREFHRPDWPSVRLSVTGELRDFDFYFEFVLQQVGLLKTLWVE
jgi:Nucleotidyl transferase AbiEii toxin, Type IV TA system